MKTLQEYERHLETTVAAWTAERRTVLAAAMGERWYPTYAAFSAAYEFGDPRVLRAALDAVWSHLFGQPISNADVARHEQSIDEVTPHMDDFDADDALAACAIVSDALKCCVNRDNRHWSTEAVMSGFGAVEPGWWVADEQEQAGFWKRKPVQKELRKQLLLLERIGALPSVEPSALTSLRQGLAGRDLVGEPRKPYPAAPVRITNQQLFDSYRGMSESDTRGDRYAPPPNASPVIVATMAVTAWHGRYSRRKSILSGTAHGPPADTGAHQILVTRLRARDVAETGLPDWDADTRFPIDRTYQFMGEFLGVRSVGDPHDYGPSLRRLWLEAKRGGASNLEAWGRVRAWAVHRPAAWDMEDQRKKKRGDPEVTTLGTHLGRVVGWASTEDPDVPWAAEVDGAPWRIRLNDFPDDYMYTLVVGDQPIGSFNDWPSSWRRQGLGSDSNS